MRVWASLLLLAVLLAAPLAAAQEIAEETLRVSPDTSWAHDVDVQDGDRYTLSLVSDQPVDLLVVNGTHSDYAAGTGGQQHAQWLLNVTQAQLDAAFPFGGPWTFIIDNSASPMGGAAGATNVTFTLHLVVVEGTIAPAPTVDSDAGSRNPWPVLMLTSPYWDLGVVGLGGMALWFLLLAAFAAWGYTAGWDKLGVLVLGVGLLVALWVLLPRGPVTQTSIPLLIAAGVAWLAYKGTADGRQSLRLGFLAGGLGALLGVGAGTLVSWLWRDHGILLVGADRFDDPIFMMSLAAGLGAFLLALIKAFVEASEDEEAAAVAGSPGLTTSFTVHCLRCQTPIKVDRSMKKYRVATDRFEFACPNCHAWMEWSEPKSADAAAAA